MAADIGEIFRRIDYGICKCRRTGACGALRSLTISERRALEAAKYYDARYSMRHQRFVRPQVTGHVRGLVDDRETLENVREALGAHTVYDIMHANMLHEPARSEALNYITQHMTFRFIS